MFCLSAELVRFVVKATTTSGVVVGQVTTAKFDPVACALKVDGTAFCWGDSVSGVAPGANTTTPALVEGGISWQQIQTGGQLSASCGIGSDGTGYCWGLLFDPTVDAAEDITFTSDSLSGTFDSAEPAEIELDSTWQDITASGSNYHVCGITTNGTAYCWGSGHLGALGDGTYTYKSLPTAVSSVGVNTWTQITAGEVQSCGVQTDKSGWCWGSNDVGEIGDGTTVNKTVPTQVSGGDEWIQISAGGHFTCGLTTKGIIKCWGCFDYDDDALQCMRGQAQLTPVAIPGNMLWRQVSSGVTHACGIDVNYEAYCFGVNLFGELGGETATSFSAEPVKVLGGYTWREVSAGLYMSCGLTNNEQVLCWGQNNDNQLGSPGRDTSVPRYVADPGPWGLPAEKSKYLPEPDIPQAQGNSSDTSENPSASSSSGGGSNAGAIAGGVIGGLAAVALIVGGVFFWRRRKAQQGGVPAMEKSAQGETSPVPDAASDPHEDVSDEAPSPDSKESLEKV